MEKYFECSTTNNRFLDNITKFIDSYKVKWSCRKNCWGGVYTFRIYTDNKIIKESIIKYFIILNMLPEIEKARENK